MHLIQIFFYIEVFFYIKESEATKSDRTGPMFYSKRSTVIAGLNELRY